MYRNEENSQVSAQENPIEKYILGVSKSKKINKK